MDKILYFEDGTHQIVELKLSSKEQDIIKELEEHISLVKESDPPEVLNTLLTLEEKFKEQDMIVIPEYDYVSDPIDRYIYSLDFWIKLAEAAIMFHIKDITSGLWKFNPNFFNLRMLDSESTGSGKVNTIPDAWEKAMKEYKAKNKNKSLGPELK